MTQHSHLNLFKLAPAESYPMAIKLIVLSLIVAGSAFGQTGQPQAAPPAPTISLEEATLKLKKLLAKHIYTLDRPVTTFRYEGGNAIMPKPAPFIPQNKEDVIRHTLAWTGTFFDSKIEGWDTMVPGVYVATDPLASRAQYGGTDPKLFVITLKSGSTILDIRAPDIFDKPIANKLWKEMACPSNYEFALDFGKIRNSQSLMCREALINAVKELHVQAILYSYVAANTFADCRSTRNEAFNIVSPDVIDTDKLAFYSNDLKIETKRLSLSTAALYREGLPDLYLQTFADNEDQLAIPRSIDHLPLPNLKTYSTWKGNFIYKCGLPRTHEPSEFDGLLELGKRYRDSDPDLFKIKLETTRAFKKRKINYGFIDFRFVRAIAQKRYYFAGMALDLSKYKQWRHGVSAIMGYQEKYSKLSYAKRISAASRYFEEKSTFAPKNDFENLDFQIFSEVFKKNVNEPISKNIRLIVNSYLKLGIPKQATTILVEGYLMYLGVPPFIVGELPTDPDKDYSEQFKENRDEMVAILKECLKIYQNPHLSDEEVQKGMCAIETDGFN